MEGRSAVSWPKGCAGVYKRFPHKLRACAGEIISGCQHAMPGIQSGMIHAYFGINVDFRRVRSTLLREEPSCSL